MTRKDAIEAIKCNWPDSRYTILREALDMAVKALEGVTDKNVGKNEPLTLDEIRQINEAIEPVYLYIFGSDFDNGWQIIEQITDTKIIFRGKTNTYVPIKKLGISYNLYRQKPKEIQK